MELITIESEATFKDVLQVVLLYVPSLKRIWLSGTDLGNDRNFYWTTNGKGFVYGTWNDGQPDNAGNNKHCIQLADLGKSYRLSDAGCHVPSPFICSSAK